MIKSYKYRIFPNEEQKILLEKHFGAMRWVYNWGLERKIKHYKETNKAISFFSLIPELTKERYKNEWLLEINAQSIQNSLLNLDKAFKKFFKKQSQFPKFKSKKDNKNSVQFVQGTKLVGKQVQLYKIGKVNIILHRTFEGKIKASTVSKNCINQYFISILVEDSIKLPKKPKITENTTIGIDLGIKTFATLSNGTKIDNPKLLIKSEQRLKVLQRRVSKKQKGSKNKEEAKQKLAKLHNKISNQRSDFLHKLTYQLTHDNQVKSIGIEDLNVSGMIKNHCLSKAIGDVAWNEFANFLSYKCDWYGKNLIKIGRFEPSSKICSKCGEKKDSLTLAERDWICKKCGTKHDRDINAAKNIKHFALLTNSRLQRPETDSK